MPNFGRSEQQFTLPRKLAMLETLKTQGSKKHVHFDVEDCEYENLTGADEPGIVTQHRPRYFNINFWFLTTVLLLAFSIVQNVPSLRSGGSGSYEKGFTTDLPDAHRIVGLEQRRFTSSLRDCPNGTLYMVSDGLQHQYIGLPSPAIDANWDTLTHGRYFQLTSPENASLHQDPEMPETIHFAPYGSTLAPAVYSGPDVLHSLHCLNSVRKHLDSSYYGESSELPWEYQRIHMDHCLDMLRQSLMCHADLTPVTLKPFWDGGEEGPRTRVFYLGQTEREHTCRRWEDVRAWVERRGEGGKAMDFS